MGDRNLHYTPFTMRLPGVLVRQLDAYSRKTGRNRSQSVRDLVSLALRLGLGNVLELPAEERVEG